MSLHLSLWPSTHSLYLLFTLYPNITPSLPVPSHTDPPLILSSPSPLRKRNIPSVTLPGTSSHCRTSHIFAHLGEWDSQTGYTQIQRQSWLQLLRTCVKTKLHTAIYVQGGGGLGQTMLTLWLVVQSLRALKYPDYLGLHVELDYYSTVALIVISNINLVVQQTEHYPFQVFLQFQNIFFLFYNNLYRRSITMYLYNAFLCFNILNNAGIYLCSAQLLFITKIQTKITGFYSS